MKLLFALLLLFVLVFIALFPMVNMERTCYEISQKNIDTINVNVLTQSWSKQMVCEHRMDELSNLESCIQDATKSSYLADYTKDLIPRIVAIIRPYSNNVFTQKADHDMQCTDFRWTLLP